VPGVRIGACLVAAICVNQAPAARPPRRCRDGRRWSDSPIAGAVEATDPAASISTNQVTGGIERSDLGSAFGVGSCARTLPSGPGAHRVLSPS
jgi:hypothetical protein